MATNVMNARKIKKNKNPTSRNFKCKAFKVCYKVNLIPVHTKANSFISHTHATDMLPFTKESSARVFFLFCFMFKILILLLVSIVLFKAFKFI